MRHSLGGPKGGDVLRTLLAISALAIVLAGCIGRHEDAEQQVRQLMTIWETGDAAPLAEIATPDVVYDDVPNGERFQGLDGVRRYVEHVHAWAAQVEITISAVHSGPDAAVAEWIMRGVQDRPIPGRVPVATNRPFELKGVTLIELRDGRIARAADYIDVLGFVVQLGGRVELPGGAVIGPVGGGVNQGDDDGAQRKASAERFFRGVYGGDPSVVDDLAADDIVISYPIFQSIFGKPTLRGRQAVKEFVGGFGKRWADPQISVEDVIGEADRVVLRWSYRARDVGSRPGGPPPTNQEHSWGGITLYRFDKTGKIVAEVGEESDPIAVQRIGAGSGER
jgi:steroid delta-isomerase-like uncharacterized protein